MTARQFTSNACLCICLISFMWSLVAGIAHELLASQFLVIISIITGLIAMWLDPQA